MRFFLQRLGFGYQKSTSSPLWIHCASVGEVTAVRPLVDAIQKQFPDLPLLLSTTTATGADTVVRQGWQNLEHQYIPVDFYGAVKRFFAATRPQALLIMETEIWPNLIMFARQRQVPTLIVNGRVSHRTLAVPGWLKPVYRQVLPQLDAILCKSEADVNGYLQLGANPKAIKKIGNIKFATTNHSPVVCELDRPFWLAASTHEDEELQVCMALSGHPLLEQSLLVIAPRHPHRSPGIQNALVRCGLRFAVRSKSQLPDENTQVYIADTLGEMPMWLSHAQAVFMGGSLVSVGGHNLLEPAAAGVAIVCGPHLDNVADEAALLQEAGAMQQVRSANELVDCVESILGDIVKRQHMSQAGKRIVTENSGVLNDYMDYILPLVSVEKRLPS